MAFVQKMEVKGKRYSVKWKKCGVNGLIGLNQWMDFHAVVLDRRNVCFYEKERLFLLR